MLPADHMMWKGKTYDIDKAWLNDVCLGRWSTGRLQVETMVTRKIWDHSVTGSPKIIESEPYPAMTSRYAVFFRSKRDAMHYKLSHIFG